MYICVKCNTKTEQWRPWLYEHNKQNIPQEETAVEQEPVGPRELSMTDETDPLASSSGESPQDNFVPFAEAGNDTEATSFSSPEGRTDSDAKHHWSHDLVLCTSPDAVSLPVSLEERVLGLEGKLHELQEQTKTGMTKLEAQLERVEQLLRTAHAGR